MLVYVVNDRIHFCCNSSVLFIKCWKGCDDRKSNKSEQNGDGEKGIPVPGKLSV